MSIYVLRGIWHTAQDERALAWAIRDGIVPLLLTIYDTKDRSGASEMLGYIAVRSIHVSVLRALSLTGDAAIIGRGGFRNPEIPRLVIDGRTSIMCRTYRKVCSSDQCGPEANAPQKCLRRCPCLMACYCSSACQLAHWNTHRDLHERQIGPRRYFPTLDRGPIYHMHQFADGTDSSGSPGFSRLSARSAHFAALCCDAYLRGAAPEICATIRESTSDSWTRPCYSLHIDFTRPGAPNYRLEGYPGDEDAPEAPIDVTADVPQTFNNSTKVLLMQLTMATLLEWADHISKEAR